VTPAHLWEHEHPYYCAEGNWFKNGEHTCWPSWAAFVASGWTRNDPELNLVWRWDWPMDCDDEDEPTDKPGDRLLLFVMLQRKAYNFSHEVAVTPNDEPAIRAYLARSAAVIAKLWAGLIPTEVERG
jgi:hypothetical protein